MKTGVQVSSLKPLLTTAAEVRAAFGRMAAMGVDTVQLQWIDPSVPPEAVAAALRENGIRSVSVQDFFQTIWENRNYYYELNCLTGGRWLCPSRVPEGLRSREGLEQFAQMLELLRQESGQEVCFHPVAADLAPIEGVCPVEFLLERLPWLTICADLYHVNKAGLSMPAFLREHPVCMVHFKEGKRLPDGTEVLVPAGRGDTDWTGVVDTCVETGIGYAFVEQERWEGDPYHRLGEALEWLEGQL